MLNRGTVVVVVVEVEVVVVKGGVSCLRRILNWKIVVITSTTTNNKQQQVTFIWCFSKPEGQGSLSSVIVPPHRSLLMAELEKEEKEKDWYYAQLQNLTKRIDSLPLTENVSCVYVCK